jgi:hypothetical protein
VFGFFKKYDVHLCSAVSGKILDNGKPVVDVKVERELMYIDEKKRVDSTLTDNNGCFTLPAVNVRSKAPGWAFCEQFTKQFIWVNLQNRHYVLWHGKLASVEPIAAYDKKLAQLNAELTDQEVFFHFTNDESPHMMHRASSICRWERDFTIQHIIED